MDCIVSENITYKVKEKVILNNISFKIGNGEVFALLGYNGAGKSTFIDILTHSFHADKGSVKIYGEDFPAVKTKVGVLYDSISLIPLLRVRELIHFFCTIYKIDQQELTPLIKILDLNRISNSMFSSLSKGERKKLGILLTLINDPSLLVLDEPTSDLDPLIREVCWLKIFRAKGRTVFFTTHIWEEAEKYADKIAFIHKGKLLTEPDSPVSFLSEKYIKGNKKIGLPKSEGLLKLISTYEYLEDDDSYYVFTSETEKLISEIQKHTINYSLIVKDLKDVYQYLVNKYHA